jgi:hypothetical protein
MNKPQYVSICTLLVILGGQAIAQEGTAPVNQPDSVVPAPIDASPSNATTSQDEDEAAPKIGLTVGADLYYGTSNLSGSRRFRDGFWLGSGPTFPSNVYGIYNGKDGTKAKVALSLGKLYNGSVEGFDQPIEAYISKNYSGIDFTVGKFYVPFELSEWEYETEAGVQASRDFGENGSLTAAMTFNRERHTANGYLRYAREIGIATVGISFGAGRGFSFDTDHDQGAALDLTLEQGSFRFESSALMARQSGESSRFGFAFARLNYQLNTPTELYVARHSWSDRLGQQGNGHYSTLGAVYRINDNFSLEGATSRSGETKKNIRWLQLHYTIER